jgi:hypothetical protein
MDTTQPQQNQQSSQPVDQQALALTHAIALQESGSGGMTPNYNAVGDNGTSKGAYQWQPGNFEAAAKNAGLDPNDFSPQNQDKVAYSEVEAYKQKGYDPGQIASLWNSGSPNNWQNHSGTTTINGKQISYDTPAYVKGVQSYYQKLTQGQSGSSGFVNSAPAPQSTQGQNNASQSPQNGLGGELEGRLNTIGTSLSDLGTQLSGQKGSQNWWSDLLHVGGSVAGGVGDIINAGLNKIPGVSNAENWVGGQVGKLADTQTGQAVVKSIQGFQQAHPELSEDIGDVANIATLIPMVKGIGMVGDSVLGSTLKNLATKGVMKAVTEQTGESLSKDAASTMVEKNLMPNIVKTGTGYAYDTTGAINKITSLKDFPPGILTALRKLNGKEYIPGKISKLIHAGASSVGTAVGGGAGYLTHGVDGGLIGGVLGKMGGKTADKIAQSSLVGLKNRALQSGSKSLLKRAVNVGLGSGALLGGATANRQVNNQQ